MPSPDERQSDFHVVLENCIELDLIYVTVGLWVFNEAHTEQAIDRHR